MVQPEETPTMIRLAVDFEFESRIWWDEGGQDLWDAITDSADESSIVVEESLAESWVAQAEKIEGWDDGLPYAPHPINVSPVDEDEEY